MFSKTTLLPGFFPFSQSVQGFSKNITSTTHLQENSLKNSPEAVEPTYDTHLSRGSLLRRRLCLTYLLFSTIIANLIQVSSEVFKLMLSSWLVEIPATKNVQGQSPLTSVCKPRSSGMQMRSIESVQQRTQFICLSNGCKSQWAESGDSYWKWALPKWLDQVCHLETVYPPREPVRNIVIEHCHMLCG